MSIKRKQIVHPEKALTAFFRTNTPQTAGETLWHLFKAWASQPNHKKQHTDKDLALFLDQLIALVAAAHQLHQTNRASITPQEGTPHA
ncbi:MAG: hypothetical protein JWQ66_4675 [Mucilaginibacter sp.]|nr:hypothetical protein [Mucilaginibacter sp.]